MQLDGLGARKSAPVKMPSSPTPSRHGLEGAEEGVVGVNGEVGAGLRRGRPIWPWERPAAGASLGHVDFCPWSLRAVLPPLRRLPRRALGVGPDRADAPSAAVPLHGMPKDVQ